MRDFWAKEQRANERKSEFLTLCYTVPIRSNIKAELYKRLIPTSPLFLYILFCTVVLFVSQMLYYVAIYVSWDLPYFCSLCFLLLHILILKLFLYTFCFSRSLFFCTLCFSSFPLILHSLFHKFSTIFEVYVSQALSYFCNFCFSISLLFLQSLFLKFSFFLSLLINFSSNFALW